MRPASQDTTKFKELRPAAPISKLSSVIILPAFSYTGLTWKGASQLLVQFNITLPQAITIPLLPSGAGRDFCLCVRHRVGTAPYRFKLWQGVGEILYPPLLYVNEVVKANATLEVWTTPASTVTNNAALSIYTSILTVPSSASQTGPLVAATGVARTPNNFGTINPTAGTSVLDYLANN